MKHMPLRAHTHPSPRSTSQLVDPRILRTSMVRYLRDEVGIYDTRVLSAMQELPRHAFVQDAFRMQAYEDRPLPIGHGQTISQPSTVAFMTQLLEIQPGMRVLEVGTGSGYQAALLAYMGCRVYTIERIPALFALTRKLLTEDLKLRNVYMKRDDGTLGMEEAAPFDRILVTAGGPTVPKPLVRQLDDPGLMLIPVGEQKRHQRLACIRKRNGVATIQDMGAAVFVDLVGNHGW